MGLAWYIGARLARLPGLPHTVASGLVVGYLGDPLLGHAALASLISMGWSRRPALRVLERFHRGFLHPATPRWASSPVHGLHDQAESRCLGCGRWPGRYAGLHALLYFLYVD